MESGRPAACCVSDLRSPMYQRIPALAQEVPGMSVRTVVVHGPISPAIRAALLSEGFSPSSVTPAPSVWEGHADELPAGTAAVAPTS